MMYTDRSFMICVGATTEVEALKKALAEAEEKAAKEQATRKSLKAILSLTPLIRTGTWTLGRRSI